MSFASARMQIDMRGRGMLGSLRSYKAEITTKGELNVLDSSRETLVPLGIVVLQSDLEFESLNEIPLLLLGILEDFLDGATHA